MTLILAIFAMICTALATVSALVFCMAAGANSTDAQYHSLKRWMSGLSLLGVAGIVVAIFLIRAGQPGWATIAAFAPTISFVFILIVGLLQ